LDGRPHDLLEDTGSMVAFDTFTTLARICIERLP
jgi:hypothetical protein